MIKQIHPGCIDKKDTLFIDTSVLLDVYGFDVKREGLYGALLKEALQKKCAIFVADLVISEYAHAFLQITYSNYKKLGNENMDYKTYRKTDEYKENTRYLNSSINNILKSIGVLVPSQDRDFYRNISSYLMTCDAIDFNDLCYFYLCKDIQAKLVTNDQDFINYCKSQDDDIVILTAYPQTKVLNRCLRCMF